MPERTAPVELPGPVAVVMSRFPAVTETFILRELVELEKQGANVVLVPLLRDEVSVLHPEAEPWDRRALYTGFIGARMLRSNLAVLMRAPLRWLSTLLALAWESRTSWNALSGLLGIYLKSVYNGQRVRALGVRHIHAHYATHPAAAAYIMSRVHTRDQADLPYSLTLHAHDIFISRAGLGRKLAAASFVRCISRFNVDYLLERFSHVPGVNEQLFRVIHCGIEPHLYRHDPPPGAPGRERPARALCIAAHRPYKGLRYLIDAFGLLRDRGVDAVLDVIGEGHLRPELEQQIRDLDLESSVKLVGTRTQQEVAEAFESTDMFVMGSIVAPDGQMEGIPVSLMEALSAGVPTIATRISGIPELVIPGETGFLVEPERPDELADAVQQVLADYASARALAARGSELVESEFEIQENVTRLMKEMAGFSSPNDGRPPEGERR
jgi:glycosyltransferase involved in cell wall biosynthesis